MKRGRSSLITLFPLEGIRLRNTTALWGPLVPKGPPSPQTKNFPTDIAAPRVTHRGTPFSQARRYLSSEEKVKVER